LFNVSLLKESQFQALHSFICSEEVFVPDVPTGSARIRQIVNISNGATRPHADA